MERSSREDCLKPEEVRDGWKLGTGCELRSWNLVVHKIACGIEPFCVNICACQNFLYFLFLALRYFLFFKIYHIAFII